MLTVASAGRVYHHVNCSDDTPGTVPPTHTPQPLTVDAVRNFIIILIIIIIITTIIRDIHHVMKLSAFSYFNGIHISSN
jgi:hypothetical protein